MHMALGKTFSTTDDDNEKDEEDQDHSLEYVKKQLFSGSLTLRRPLEGSTLDGRVLKALRRQEERRERTTARRREVRTVHKNIIIF